MKNDMYPFNSGSETVSIIIRHAERHPITDMSQALDARLTENGKHQAYALGRSLISYSPLDLYYSPVPRCLETAQSLHKGVVSASKDAVLMGPLHELGGPYIIGNWMDVVTHVKKHGQSLFIRKWFNNELPADMIMPLPLAAELHLRLIGEQLKQGKSVINITHDWNIMVMREYYFNMRHEEIGEPDFLDGFLAYKENNSILLTYHGHSKKIPVPGID